MDLTTKIKQFICSKIAPNCEQLILKETDSLIESGIIDSLAIIKLLSFLEEEFSIQVTNDDLMPDNFETIQSISHLVQNKLRN